MNPSPTPDLSLYQIALDNLTTPQSLKISPALLKSLVGATLDVMVEEKIPATLWVKFLPITNWQSELQGYLQQVGLLQAMYLCHCIGDESAEVATIIGEAREVDESYPLFPIPLAAGSQLRRELFLLVLSDQFSSLIVASQLPQTEPADPGQSQSFQVVCTFERRVIQRVLEGITSIIAVADSTPDELLERWGSRFPLHWVADERDLLTQVLVKQLQRIEEILHPSTVSQLVTDKTTLTSLPEDLRNKDELLKQVAQELKTPLTNMKTALSLLDSPQIKPTQRQRYMQLLNTECDRQNSLIAGLLDLVQVDQPQNLLITPVELADIIPGVVSTYQPLAQEKGIQIGYTIPSDLPPVSCLEAWLRQITINLLHNSLKFTSTGGQVRVLASLQGECIQLTFTDTGMGIAESEIPKIFDSFYRGRPIPGAEMGAGLGLTIVQQLLLRCGGSISVSSKVGKGSTFKLLLPIAPGSKES
ncbi:MULTISPECIES: DICT sensory domain-containing protein [unclassified Coleofasciculus]|uniref:DICT sensory domain-containing protein n=1 Tax=unclassified Coleofasciculus TaxID=2692782 RepID=UPI001880B14A|nr:MULTISPECIES: DICT sensory domain-containing protein [unclassified Coleofasciculus]MBE9126436.1 hypothetical protein [Coleofasciculus sp. LEGE 07081]MBE9148038.1 hypothetical protein [Coleofasciculus sp. LEGE 07092]